MFFYFIFFAFFYIEIWETQTYCCTEDGCNGSSTIEASAVVVMLPLVMYIVNEILNIMKQQNRR